MRKVGSCIIDERVRFKKGFQKRFIREVKYKAGLTWYQLAEFLNVSEYTVRVDWQKERTSIPKTIVINLLRKYPFEKWQTIKSEWISEILQKNWGQKLAGGRNLKRIIIPDKIEDFAEFLSIVLGDGYLNSKGLRVVSEYPFEVKHMEYVKQQMERLFNLKSRIYLSSTNDNTVVLNCYSIELVKLLQNNGLSIGNKIDNGSSLPNWIFKKKNYVYAALRGLFDTDGGIFEKQKNYDRALIEFQTSSPYIRDNLINLLNKADFAFSETSRANSLPGSRIRHNIRIQYQDDIHRFFRLVGSSNPKNIVKYKLFLKYGLVPRKKQVSYQINNFSDNLPFKLQF